MGEGRGGRAKIPFRKRDLSALGPRGRGGFSPSWFCRESILGKICLFFPGGRKANERLPQILEVQFLPKSSSVVKQRRACRNEGLCLVSLETAARGGTRLQKEKVHSFANPRNCGSNMLNPGLFRASFRSGFGIACGEPEHGQVFPRFAADPEDLPAQHRSDCCNCDW